MYDDKTQVLVVVGGALTGLSGGGAVYLLQFLNNSQLA
jgi:hypothetical protein